VSERKGAAAAVPRGSKDDGAKHHPAMEDGWAKLGRNVRRLRAATRG
jgi:hypothetical protein